MLNKLRRLIPALTLLLLPGTGPASSGGSGPERQFFPPAGESMTFLMRWKANALLPAMEAGTITIRWGGPVRIAGREAWLVEALALSKPGFRMTVRDYFASYLAPGSGQTLHVRTLLREDGEQRQQLLYFYPETGRLWLKEYFRKGTGEPLSVSRNELHGGVPFPLHDILGLVPVLRERLARGENDKSFHTSYLARIKKIQLASGEKKREETAVGFTETAVLRVNNLFGDLMDREEAFEIWATTNPRYIPVRLSAKVKIGKVEGKLIEYRRDTPSLAPVPGDWLVPAADVWPPAPPDRTALTVPAGPAGSDMIRIPGGLLTINNTGGASVNNRSIFVDGFEMDRTEVTNARYHEFIRQTGRAAPGIRPFAYYRKKFGWKIDGYEEYSRLAAPYCWKDGRYPPGSGQYPVVLVSWEDAAAFARWAGLRLPTEAEWAHAARQTAVPGDYPWGPDWFPGRANTAESDWLGTVPAGFLTAGGNRPGILDLCGNVSEWTADWFAEEPFTGGSRNPAGPGSGKLKVMRGGNWAHPRQTATIWFRGADWPENTYVNVGFRCVRNLQ